MNIDQFPSKLSCLLSACLLCSGFFILLMQGMTAANAQVQTAPIPSSDAQQKPDLKSRLRTNNPRPKPGSNNRNTNSRATQQRRTQTKTDNTTKAKTTSNAQAGRKAKDTVLRVANLGQPNTLDPHQITNAWEARIVGDLFLGLVTEGPSADIVPGVAKDWTVSDDGLIYRFSLRKTTWSDNTPLTASDFVYSFARALSPDTKAFFAPGLYAIKNAMAYNARKIDDPDELGVKAIDPSTLEITLHTPDAFFLEQLTHPIAYPVPRHRIEQTSDIADTESFTRRAKSYASADAQSLDTESFSGTQDMVSNGAYVLDRWADNGFIQLGINPTFYDRKNIKITQIDIDADTDIFKAVENFESGDVDIARDISGKDIDKLRTSHKDETFITPYLGVYYFTLNLNYQPFQSKKVRQALSMALDRETITNKVLRTGEMPAYTMVPPGINTYRQPIPVEWQYMPYDERIKQAKTLMEDTGFNADTPLSFTLSYSEGDDDHERIALAAIAMWKKIHVNATVARNEALAHYERLQVGRFQAGRASWISQHNDASSFLSLLHSGVGNLNYGRFKNQDYDSLLEKAADTINLKERVRLFEAAEKILIEEQPVIPVYYYVSRNLVSSSVKGWKANIKDVQRTRYLSLR